MVAGWTAFSRRCSACHTARPSDCFDASANHDAAPAPVELKPEPLASPEKNSGLCNPPVIQEEPARKLKNLQNVPIVLVTAEASFASPGNRGAVAYFKQAGVKAEELRLVSHNIHGNGHMMMVEKNNREVLKPILAWVEKNVNAGARASSTKNGAKKDSTAMKLADMGYFWVGAEEKKMPYGTILTGIWLSRHLVIQSLRRNRGSVRLSSQGLPLTSFSVEP